MLLGCRNNNLHIKEKKKKIHLVCPPADSDLFFVLCCIGPSHLFITVVLVSIVYFSVLCLTEALLYTINIL